MIDVCAEVTILRPRSEVAEYMFDPANERAWTSNVVESRPLTPGPLQKGSKVERVVKFLGRQFGYLYEVVDSAPDSFVEIVVSQPFPMHVRYELEDAPGGTLARIVTKGDPSGFFRLMAPMMTGKVRSSIQKDLEDLKRIIESRA
jgi:hypothetical protein